MENKNKNNHFKYLSVGLLLLSTVVVGVWFSSLKNSGSANLVAMNAAGDQSNYNCVDIKSKLDAGTNYTADEKDWYNQNCTKDLAPTPDGQGGQAGQNLQGPGGQDQGGGQGQGQDQGSTPCYSKGTVASFVCGKNGKSMSGRETSYFNSCDAKQDGAEIIHDGVCEGQKPCSDVADPVCGNDGVTWVSACYAIKDGGGVQYTGVCKNQSNGGGQGGPGQGFNPGFGKDDNGPGYGQNKQGGQGGPGGPGQGGPGAPGQGGQGGGYYTPPQNNPCATLKDIMAKYSNDPKSQEYLSAQWKFNVVCNNPMNPGKPLNPGNPMNPVNPMNPGNPVVTPGISGPTETGNVCTDLKTQLETSIKNNDTSSDTYAKLKLTYQDLCTESKPATDACSSLKSKLELGISSGAEDYSSVKEQYLKSCSIQVPPAGFEDKVMTTFDQNPFTDTTIADLSGKAAVELYRRGVIGGFSDGTFGGEKPVNRAEAAKFLLLAKYGTVADATDATSQFKDTLQGQWYVKYIEGASKLGIIKGYTDGTFRPGKGVNTAEFLKMMTLTFNLETDLTYTYSDVLPTDWFATYAGIASKYNLFPDRKGETLQPAKLLTRNEVAVAIYQYLSNRSDSQVLGDSGRG